MSVEAEARGAGAVEPEHEAHQHTHPGDSKYYVVAAILAVITALEVGTYFLEDPSTTLLVAALVPMMVAKFAIVAGWFMHLRYDNPLFRRVFVFGLLLAVAVYIIVLLSMQYFSDSYG
ncbi:MAG TPA: cytochrome C oxidase subunit IV family protein [Acidimicrobiales bacterium]